MSQYDDRQAALKERIATAQQGLADVPDEQRAPVEYALRRLEETLGFTVAVIDQTDPELVPDATHNELVQSVDEIANNLSIVAGNPAPYADQLLSIAGRLPTAPGEVVAQKLKETIANLQRSAQQRLNALDQQVGSVKAEVQTAGQELATRRQEIAQLVEETRQEQDQQAEARNAQVDQRLQELQATIETQQQRIDALATEQDEAFRKSQDERAEEHRQHEQAYEQQISSLEQEARERTESLLNDIDTMKTKSAALVGAYRSDGDGRALRRGVQGAAEGREYVAHRDSPFRGACRRGCPFCGRRGQGDHRWREVGHRAHPRRRGDLHSAAVEPSPRTRGTSPRPPARPDRVPPIFIETLPEEDRVEETVRMVRRSFLGAQAQPEDDDEPGPGPLSQFVQRGRKRDQE